MNLAGLQSLRVVLAGTMSTTVLCEMLPPTRAVVRIRDADGYRSRSACIAIALVEGASVECLLVSSSSKPGVWILPGGGQEGGGETAAGCCEREAMEEGGVAGRLSRPLCVVTDVDKKHHTTVFALAITSTATEGYEDCGRRRRHWLPLPLAAAALSPHHAAVLAAGLHSAVCLTAPHRGDCVCEPSIAPAVDVVAAASEALRQFAAGGAELGGQRPPPACALDDRSPPRLTRAYVLTGSGDPAGGPPAPLALACPRASCQ